MDNYNNSDKNMIEDINNYDYAMIIEEKESTECNNYFLLGGGMDNVILGDSAAANKNNNFSSNKINFTTTEDDNHNQNHNNQYNNAKINLNSNANYFAKMAESNQSNNNNNNSKQSENINISFNENDLNEIYDSKQAKNKILCCELLNFTEVFIHSVLYLRKVYPQEAFENYIIYNLNLKFITDPEINEYISEFLDNLENMLLNNLIKRITINIIEPESKRILEFFNLNIQINEYFNDLVYSDVCLHLKSLLYKFQMDFANKKQLLPELNKSFILSIETFDSKIFSGTSIKTFKELNSAIEDNFVIEFYTDIPIKLIANSEICAVLDHVNFSFTISRNFL